MLREPVIQAHSTHDYIAFSGTRALQARGNPCRVTVSQQRMEPWQPAGDAVHCYTWPIDEHRAHVECYSPTGQRIELCGHGLLCATALWSERWPGDGVLTCGDREIPCRTRRDRCWVGFETPGLTAINPPKWLIEVLGSPTHQCAEIGDDTGYLLAELPPGSDLAALQRPGDALARQTDRALLVCTQGLKSGSGQPQYHFRYFAPQYGTPEDSATGSAMRLLAAHALATQGFTALVALQLSPGRGLLFSHVEGANIWVGGRVEAAGKSP